MFYWLYDAYNEQDGFKKFRLTLTKKNSQNFSNYEY